jgi:hypothetical protein
MYDVAQNMEWGCKVLDWGGKTSFQSVFTDSKTCTLIENKRNCGSTRRS